MAWKSVVVLLFVAHLGVGPLSESVAAQGHGKGTGSGRGSAGTRNRSLAREQPPSLRQLPRSQQEPAFAAGYDEGYQEGLADRKRGDRYDPVDSRQYRDGDQGYADTYGSKDAYRNNYRAGFRQGYEAGYRNTSR